MSSHNVLVIATEGSAGSPAAALLARCRGHAMNDHWWVTMLGDSQLRVEHALSLTRADLCVFVRDDAADDGSASRDPRRSHVLHSLHRTAGHQMASSEGALTPEDLVHTLATLGRHVRDPRCYVLTLASGAASGEGLDSAFGFLLDLIEHPDTQHWDARVT